MAQNWGDVPGSEKVKDSRQDLLDRFETLATNWSGASSPPSPQLYQWWMDTTTGKLKLCTQVTPAVIWKEVPVDIALGVIVQTARTIATAVGLTGGGNLSADRNIALDFNALTEDATPDRAADFVATYDASASGHKKVKVQNLAPGSSDTVAGLIEIADQAEMEAASDTGRAVVPGRAKYHPGAVKEWVVFTNVSSTSILASLAVSSLTDNAPGDTTINHAQAFSSANYSPSGMVRKQSPVALFMAILDSAAPTASALRVIASNDSGGLEDSAYNSVKLTGDY